MKHAIAMVLCLTLSGCATLPPQRGGMATIGKAIMRPFQLGAGKVAEVAKVPAKVDPLQAGSSEVASITQPDNPGQQSAQEYDFTREEEITFAQASVITTEKDGVKTVTQVPAGSKKVVRENQRVGQTIGAAQKDTARETSALLGSFKWVQGLGVLVMLAGVIGFAHPAARLLIGGKDTALVVGLTGLGMIVGPFLLVQYANWFAGGVVLAAAYWFLSRSKYKEAQLDALKEKDVAP